MAAPTDELAESRAISFINTFFGDDVDKLKDCKDVHKDYKAMKKAVTKQISSISSSTPAQIKSAEATLNNTNGQMKNFSKKTQMLYDDISNHQADNITMVKDISSLITDIEELEKYTKYMKVLSHIEDLSSDIQSAMLINSTDRAVGKFSELAELMKVLEGSNCFNLVSYGQKVIKFWSEILKDKLFSAFNDVLNAYQWPFIVKTTTKVKKDQKVQNVEELKSKLEPLFTHILHLRLPDSVMLDNPKTHPLIMDLPGWRQPLLPLEIMLQPFKKRFKYHFSGKRQTNSLDKPEWYLTLILTWMQDHREFLSSKIQCLLEKCGLGYIDVVVEFARGLVVLAMEKLINDIPEIIYDDHTFSHLVDEILSFDKDLRTVYNYPESQPGLLHILTQDEPFNKWIIIEKKFALEKMDAMTSSTTAWQSQYENLSDVSDVDILRVPECGESFMTLIITISERYKHLPFPWAKLKFLDLQLELIDDYRIRLLQVKNQENNSPLGRIFTAILNTVNCITDALTSWSDMVFFVELYYHRVKEQQEMLAASGTKEKPATETTEEQPMSEDVLQPTASIDLKKLGAIEEGSLFDEMLQLYRHMRKDMLDSVISYVTDDVKARSRPYRKDKWLALPSQKDLTSPALSATACEMFLVLKDHLHEVQQTLAKSLFVEFWHKVASNLNTFIYKDLILANHFNDGGTAQLNFDMTRNLFPLFGLYTQKPENYFKDVKEACILLNLNTGSAKLLKQVLYESLHTLNNDPNQPLTDPIAALQDFNIYKLSPEDAELVLSLRASLTAS